MDDHQSPSSNKTRKSAVALPSQKRCLIKKTKSPGNLAGTCALSPSPSKTSFIISPNQATRIPSTKNAKAGPSASPNAAFHCHDLTSPIRVSSRVSRPTFKKKALYAKEPRLPESDGTPPLSIVQPTSSPSLKQKRPKSSPTKRLAGNNTPSKRKLLVPNPIELTSSDDDSRPRSQKRIKHTHKNSDDDNRPQPPWKRIKNKNSDDDSRPQPPWKRIKHNSKSTEVIDLCSESEEVIASPRHTSTRDKGSVVVLSTDEEVDLEPSALSHLAFRKIDTRKGPVLSPLRDVSPPIEIESVFQASPPSLAHNTPVPKPKVLVSEKDGVTDDSNKYAEKVNLPRGSLQVLYNEALTRCSREPRRAKDISERPSPFSSLKCVPPARTIRYATQTQSPSLHTPLFFSRIIPRMSARLKQSKTLDAKAFSDARASFSNSKAFPDAATFSAISNDTDLNSMEVSKPDEDQDTLTYPDAVMDVSAVDSEDLEIATETILMPSIDFRDDTSSDTQVTSISPSILINNIDLSEKLISRSLGSPSPLPNQENMRPEVTILEDTPILHSIPAQGAYCRPITPDGANSFAISPNMLCNTPSNSDAVTYQFGKAQKAETSLFEREICVDQVATIEPKDAESFFQALQQIYDVSNNNEFSLHPASELNDKAKPSAAFEHLSELPPEYESIINTSSVAISTNVHTSSTSKYLPEWSMEQEMRLDLSSPVSLSSKDVSSASGFEYFSESPAIPNLYPLTRSSSTATLSSRASTRTRSLQSLDSIASIESVNCHLLTPDVSPSPLTPIVKAQKQESLICSNPFLTPTGVSFGMSELSLQTITYNMFDEDDDDISISGMELAYPEESHTI